MEHFETTIVSGIVCKKCNHTLPPMTMKQHLISDFNTECPHRSMTEVFYKDEATKSVWIGMNPRGCYIDLMRVSDGFIMENAHSIGHHINGIAGAYQSLYRNKRPHVNFQYRSVFAKISSS